MIKTDIFAVVFERKAHFTRISLSTTKKTMVKLQNHEKVHKYDRKDKKVNEYCIELLYSISMSSFYYKNVGMSDENTCAG